MSVVSASVAVKGVPMFMFAAAFSVTSGIVFNPVLNTGGLVAVASMTVSARSPDFVMA